MGWSWRRRWGFTLLMTHPRAGVVQRDVWSTRYWTRAGAQYAADALLADGRSHPALRTVLSAEVSRLPPPIDYYADRFWRGDEYIGPDLP